MVEKPTNIVNGSCIAGMVLGGILLLIGLILVLKKGKPKYRNA